MQITFEFPYTEPFVPKGCRKPRPTRFTGKATVTIRKVTSQQAPLAIRITCKEGKTCFADILGDYHAYGGKFYRTGEFHWIFPVNDYRLTYQERQAVKDVPPSLGFTPHEIKPSEWTGYHFGEGCTAGPGQSESANRAAFKRIAAQFLIIDGVVHRKAPEPRYVWNCGGLGGNHGGTYLDVRREYNSNIPWNHYFRLDQLEEAKAAAIQVAERRRDTDSVPRIGIFDEVIEVLRPDLLRLNPRKEHGDGDPFINKVQGITQSCGGDPVLAGLGALLCLSKELSSSGR